MENRLPLRISLPFVAGVACGAVVGSGDFSTALEMTAQVSLLLVVFCLGALTLSKKHDRWIIPVMLFALGMFCYCSRAADFWVSPHWGWPAGLMDRLRGVIDGAGFADERTAPLLRALMTGDRSGLDRQTVSAFRLSGASHLLALSGLHMGVIAVFVRRVLMVLGKSRPAEIVRSALLVSFCLAYTIACGASPSLVRALIFVVLGQVAALSPGRRSVLSDRLCIAATVQLALDPMAISSVAFQLSYLAMIGIVSIAPRLEAWYPAAPAEGHSGQGRPSIVRILLRLDPFRRIWKAASLAISCQLTTAPLVWLRFGNFPHYFLLTNLLAMPVCELLLPVAILTLVLGSPAFMVRATDFLSGLLLEILQIISGL